MSKSHPKHAVKKAAADALVELALISLEAEFLRWDQGLNMSMVELVWNAHSLDSGPVRCNLIMCSGAGCGPSCGHVGDGPVGAGSAGGRRVFTEADTPEQGVQDPELDRMLKKLTTVRAMRWGELDFLVLGLSVRTEVPNDLLPYASLPKIVFCFDLTWDDGETFHPCEIVVDHTLAGPADVN